MAGRGSSSSAAGSSMMSAGGRPSYMTAEEINDLQKLLKRAKETGQVGAAMHAGKDLWAGLS